jgi:MFS family permease
VILSRDLKFYLAVRFCSVLASQIQTVAVGWQVYDLTRDPFALGFIGLAQFLPMVLLVLPAGDIADRVDRRHMLMLTHAIQASAACLLLLLTFSGSTAIWPFYCVVGLFGVASGLYGPAMQSYLPFLVPSEVLPKAITWASSIFQIAVIAGPALGGFLYIFGAHADYGTSLSLFLLSLICISQVRPLRRIEKQGAHKNAFARATEGIRYVRAKPILLGAISLDLFAVLFGGVTALLPIYARDILHTGPEGLGLLRAAPAAGAALMAFVLVRWPLQRHVGIKMFACVGLFGLATITFGLSEWYPLSLIALAVLGAADEVSVVVRSSLVQLATPDHMRGRVSAVNVLFIGTSNQLGEFESGVTAGLFGTVPAVVIGGIGTIIVVALWMNIFPALRRIDRFAEIQPVAAKE